MITNTDLITRLRKIQWTCVRGRGTIMKKTTVAFACLVLCIVAAGTVSGKEAESVRTLPPVVAQTYGMAGTIIMWHTIDGDGKADYKATYVFKDGKLIQISQTVASQDDFRYQIIGR